MYRPAHRRLLKLFGYGWILAAAPLLAQAPDAVAPGLPASGSIQVDPAGQYPAGATNAQGASAQSQDYYPTIDGVRPPASVNIRDLPPRFYSAREFTIPFNVAATGRQPVEVQLLVSRDAGANWEVFERAKPSTKSFQFMTEVDGAFLFSLRTIDDRGMAYPNTKELLHVVIDATKPELSLGVDLDPTGELVAQCWIREPWVDTESVRLEYQSDAALKWEAVPVEFLPGQNKSEWLGTATWTPPREARNVMVRLIAADKAGNQHEASRVFTMPRLAQNGGVQLASQRQDEPRSTADSSSIEMTPGGSPWLPGASASQRASDRRSTQQPLGRPNRPADSSAAANAMAQQPNRAGSGWTATNPASFPPAAEQMPFQKIPNDQFAGNRSQGASSTVPSSTVPSSAAPSSTGRLAASSNNNSIPMRGASGADSQGLLPGSTATESFPIRTQVEPEELPAPEGIPTESLSEPSGLSLGSNESNVTSQPSGEMDEAQDSMQPNPDNTFYSRARAFSLDYGVDLARGSGVHAIELWGTADQGKSWDKWGVDEDRESPFDIRVKEEGLFGFRIVVVGRNLVASNQPKNGEPADVWVVVDTQAPDVKISSALYGEGEEAGNLVIEYICDDPTLIERPISLSFSDRVDGPWTTIATGLRNTGRYLWPADPNLPRRIYLRIEAIDQATNVGVHTLDLPIEVEGLAPRGKIRGFKPIDEEARTRRSTIRS